MYHDNPDMYVYSFFFAWLHVNAREEQVTPVISKLKYNVITVQFEEHKSQYWDSIFEGQKFTFVF